MEGGWLKIVNSEFEKRKNLCGLGVSAVKKGYRRGAETLRSWPRRSGALQSGQWSIDGGEVGDKLRPMTKLLEQAFQKASKLPKEEQDAMAAFMIGELESEKRWDALFAGSQDRLREMAAEALEEDRTGGTAELNLDRDFPKD